jgi:SAM-dependent methyltransferase
MSQKAVLDSSRKKSQPMDEQWILIKLISMQNSNRSCPCCNNVGVLKFPSKIDDTLLSSKSYSSRKIPELMHYSYFECVNCQTLFVDELPSSEFLANSYNEAEFVSRKDSVYAAQTYFEELQRLNLLNVGNLLDIGCSDGAFISIVKSKSAVEVAGIEPSIHAINSSDLSVRESIQHTNLESFQSIHGFNIVTCFQTIEHVNDLNGLVAKAKELLLDHGNLVFVCHDRLSIVNRILGERSPIFDIEHLQILNKRGVQLLMQMNGFVDVTVNSISNKYPISYWLLLAPIPKFLKTFSDGKRNKWYLSWGIRIRVGNLLAVGTKSAG